MFTRFPRTFTIRAASGVALSLVVLTAGVLSAQVAQAQEVILVAGDAASAAPDAPAALAKPAVKVLTLDEAIKMALENQPTIRAARASMDNAVIARETANSTLSVLAGPIVTVRRKQADLGVSITRAAIDEAELNTVYNVTRTYLTTIYAQDQLKVAEDFADRMNRLRESTEDALKAGSKFVKAADLDRIDTYALTAQARAVEARIGIARAKAALREAIGAPADCCLDFATDTLDHYYQAVKSYCGNNNADLGCCCLVDAALNNRPEILIGSLGTEMTRLEIDAQGLSLHPYSKTFASLADIHGGAVPGALLTGEYNPGFLLPEYPVYLAGHRTQRQQQAHALYQRAGTCADKVRGLVALETEDHCLRLTQEAGQVGLYRSAAEKAEKTVEHGKAAYRNQQGGIDNWLEAEGVAAQARGKLNESLYRYALALAGLQKATAGKLWNCLEKVPQTKPTDELKKPPEPPK